jgi:hypothetical protein
MIRLFRKDFPSSKDELAQALDEALHRFVHKEGSIVDVRSRVFPYLDEIAINLDGARFDSLPPAPSSAADQIKPAFEAAVVTLSAQKISIHGVPLDLRMGARDVALHKGTDANGEAVLLMPKVSDGQVTVSVRQLELEKAIAQMGARETGRHGITLEEVRLAIRARGPRSLAADVRIQARKFLLRAKIDISGQIDIDENFVAKIFLKCKSDGAIGSLACSALDPILGRLNNKSFSFASVLLGEIQFRDIRLAVADTVELTADFGSAPRGT